MRSRSEDHDRLIGFEFNQLVARRHELGSARTFEAARAAAIAAVGFIDRGAGRGAAIALVNELIDCLREVNG